MRLIARSGHFMSHAEAFTNMQGTKKPCSHTRCLFVRYTPTHVPLCLHTPPSQPPSWKVSWLYPSLPTLSAPPSTGHVMALSLSRLGRVWSSEEAIPQSVKQGACWCLLATW